MDYKWGVTNHLLTGMILQVGKLSLLVGENDHFVGINSGVSHFSFAPSVQEKPDRFVVEIFLGSWALGVSRKT